MVCNIANPLCVAGFGAFAGAFFSFLFVSFGGFIGRVYRRKLRHFNALVILGTELNKLGGMINDNLYLIPPFREAILRGNVYFSRLSVLPVDKSHYENLHDMILINELFSFNYQLRKLNDDIEGLMGGYSDIKNALIEQNITPQDYMANAKKTAQMLTTLEMFLKDMEQKNVDLMAMVRLMSKRDVPLATTVARWFIRTSGSGITKKQKKGEAKKLLAEIRATKRRSRKEIDKVVGKAGRI